jgi:AraC-like DNA-binding protein
MSMRTRRGQSDAGSWELVEGRPAALLQGLVAGYVGFVEASATTLRRREPPSGTPVLVINFGVPLELAAPGRATAAHAEGFVARMSELPTTTAFRGTSAGVQVDFSPLGMHLFCGLPMHELPAPAVGVGELLDAEGRRLAEALADAPGWEARFELLDAVITRRFAAARPPTASVEWAWRALEASAGAVSVGRLAERIGCSRRHLIAGFRDHFGVTPKTAARIVRFERAARRVRGDRDSLARIAAESGYHDQAHMAREFRALAGMAPSVYRTAALPGYLGVPDVADDEVTFVQGAGSLRA